eukprot:jgi/Tetstr1/448658/TSEL_035901.t1
MAQGNVTVAECGCLGNCGKGPNVEFVIPGEEGLVYHAVEGAAGAAAFLEEHCAGTPAAQAAEAYGHKLRGDELVEKKDYQGAIAAYSQALDLDQTAAALTNRASVYLKLGKFAAAVEDAEMACEAKSDWVPPQLVAAYAYEELKDKENALRCLSNAYSLDNELMDDAEFKNRVRWVQDM